MAGWRVRGYRRERYPACVVSLDTHDLEPGKAKQRIFSASKPEHLVHRAYAKYTDIIHCAVTRNSQLNY